MLADCLARTAANGCTHAVMELSSRALSQGRSAGIDFDVACLTNVRSRRLGQHRAGSCRKAKATLLAHLQPEGFAIVNADDPLAAACLEQCDGPVLSIGMRAAAELTASVVEQLPSEQTFLLHVGSHSAAVRTRLIGTPNIYNALAAAAVGLVYGMDMAAIVRGLEAVECVPGRLERLECGQPYSVFVDHAHTAGALAGCLATLRAVTHGRLICLFGARDQCDPSSRPALARAVEGAVDLAVVTSDNPGGEPPRQIAAQVMAGFKRPQAARLILDRAEAIAWTLAQARPGDCVLIAGKGHQRYQLPGHEWMEFDDRRLARCWLYESPTFDKPYRASA
jgi:UDP-N-acetylmuramoyl-L-alanyl-D-glutamate--2,6-diaminopimelate ligase